MLLHPEQDFGEIFVGNTQAQLGVPAYLKSLKTARVGKQAYDIHNVPLSLTYMLPLFIGKSDEDQYDRIMVARLQAVRRS